MSRRVPLTAALTGLSALALGLLAGSSAMAGDPDPKPATWMTVRGLTDRATLTSICGADRTMRAFCGGTDDPFVGKLPVEPRDVVRVRTRPGAGRVKAYLVRRANHQIAEWIDWNRRAIEIDESNGRRWRFRLPHALEDANAIHLFVHYPSPGAPYPGGNTVHQATYTSRVVHD
jgi:hypothetical protein